MQSTSEVCAALREIAVLLEFSGAPKFKVKADERGAEVVKTVGDLGPLVEQGRLGELEGIGATLSSQIQELWNTGNSQYLRRLRDEQPPGTSELAQVQGVTPKRLRAPVHGLGVRSVAELRAACAECARWLASDQRQRSVFDVLRYGTIMARRGGLRRQDVLNTQSAERFIQLVRPTGAAA